MNISCASCAQINTITSTVLFAITIPRLSMEDANQQVNNDVDNEENFEEFEDPSYDSEGEVLDNNNTFEKLKRNDPAIADIELIIPLNCSDEHFFNKINWEEDGNCIGFNTHIKRLMLTYYGNPFERPYNQPYILGEQGNDLPTRQQLKISSRVYTEIVLSNN